GSDKSCSQLTDTMYCPLVTNACGGGSTGSGQIRLIEMQDPTFSSIQNKTIFNDYILNASNPGQFYYNVFAAGAPTTTITLHIEVPYPFITQGANPIQVHDGVSLSGGCFVPSPSLSGFTITTDGGSSSSGYPVILLSDYMMQNIGDTTMVTVTGP